MSQSRYCVWLESRHAWNWSNYCLMSRSILNLTRLENAIESDSHDTHKPHYALWMKILFKARLSTYTTYCRLRNGRWGARVNEDKNWRRLASEERSPALSLLDMVHETCIQFLREFSTLKVEDEGHVSNQGARSARLLGFNYWGTSME